MTVKTLKQNLWGSIWSRNWNHNFWVLKIALLLGIGGILYGYDIGVISGALLFINKTIPMDATQTGLVVGAVLGGALVGTLMAGSLADRCGRRLVIVMASGVFMAGVICILMAQTFAMLMVARLLLGLGVGVVAVAVPLYVSELVPAKDRGKYVTFFQLFLTLGIVLAYGADLFFSATGNWRAMFAVVLVPTLILLMGALRLPESPRWLVGKGQLKKARAVLGRTFSTAKADAALIEIHNSFKESEGTWSSLFSSKLAMPLFIAICVAVLTQWTGVNAFLQYAPSILQQAGLPSTHTDLLGTMGIGAINFICTLVALLFVDRIGRKPLLITGVAGLVGAQVFLAVISGMHLHPHIEGLYALYGLCAFIFFYAIGPGLVIWLLIAEMFPTCVRGKGMAVCLFFNSLAGTLLASLFMNLEHVLQLSGTYWLCAASSAFYLFIAVFLLPETKSKSLEDIQAYFARRRAFFSRSSAGMAEADIIKE